MDMLFKLSIIIFIGLIGGRVANRFHLPNVSGYIVAGLLIGPSFLGLITSAEIAKMGILNEIALGAIAFSIGNEFLIKDMKKVGKDIMIITLAQFLTTFVVVFAFMFIIFKQTFAFSIVISSIATATAPAGIMLVVRELRAKGPLVNTILPVVAIDDALGIMLFGISLSIAKITTTAEKFSLFKIVSSPIIEIVGSLLLGFIFGSVLSYFGSRAKCKERLLAMTLGFIFLVTGISNILNFSALLACMMLGATLVNTMQNSKRLFNLVDDIVPPIYLMFFTLAGVSLDLRVLSSVGLIGVFYIVARAIGKILGARIGAKMVGAEENIVNYLGMSLMTLGGVSIGLSMIVAKDLPGIGEKISTLVLFSVLIFEVFGPIFTKLAIVKSGEDNVKTKDNSKLNSKEA